MSKTDNQLSREGIEAAFERIHALCGTRTQVELSRFLGVQQSTISDARRRRSIPDSWLVCLMRRTGADPDWVLTGQGERWRLLSADYRQPVDRAEIEAEIRRELDNLDVGQLVARLQALIPDAVVTIGCETGSMLCEE
ncbi:MAG: helix-turn-helix domain-containing protein [Desulfovibrio sp.]|jgi:hypothetical protein